MVYAHHKHGGFSKRGRDDDPFGSTLQANPSLLQGSEDMSGLHHVSSSSITPFDIGRISLLEDGDGLFIDDKLPIFNLDCAIKLAMGRITLEHVDHEVEVYEGSLTATFFTLPELKAALVTRYLIQRNPFTPIFTVMS